MPENEVSIGDMLTGADGSLGVEISVGETLFVNRMDSIDNLLLMNFVCSALLVGCALASMVMMWFHRR